MSTEHSKDPVSVEQIDLAQRKTSEARYAIAGAAALLLYVSGQLEAGASDVVISLCSSATLIAAAVFCWSSFEIEKLFRARQIHHLSPDPPDGDEMAYDKERTQKLWMFLDISEWAQSLSYFGFAISAVLFAMSGTLFRGPT